MKNAEEVYEEHFEGMGISLGENVEILYQFIDEIAEQKEFEEFLRRVFPR